MVFSLYLKEWTSSWNDKTILKHYLIDLKRVNDHFVSYAFEDSFRKGRTFHSEFYIKLQRIKIFSNIDLLHMIIIYNIRNTSCQYIIVYWIVTFIHFYLFFFSLSWKKKLECMTKFNFFITLYFTLYDENFYNDLHLN